MAKLSLQLLDGLLQSEDLVEERALQRLIKRRQLLGLRRVSLLLQLPSQAIEDLQNLHFLCSRIFRHFGLFFSITSNKPDRATAGWEPRGCERGLLTWRKYSCCPHLDGSVAASSPGRLSTSPEAGRGGASGALAPGRLRACKRARVSGATRPEEEAGGLAARCGVVGPRR